MSDALASLCYLLLVLVDYLLDIIYGAARGALCLVRLLLRLWNSVSMTENTKKRKHGTSVRKEGTTVVRGIIDANWQKLLSNKLIMDKGAEKPPVMQERYTGAFRRTRKMKADLAAVDVNLESSSAYRRPQLNKGLPNGSPLQTALCYLESLQINNAATNKDKVNTKRTQKKCSLTKFIAMDCEMVGIGYEGGDHMLARISLVNKFGDCIYDKFVKPREEVKDYRTDVSGIRKEDLVNGEDFGVVQREVAEMLRGRVLVGHSLKNDLAVLYLSHPKRNIRDTSKYKPFRKITKGSTPSLKRLAKEILGVEIQHGEHSSVEDAKAAMQLYCTVAKSWEQALSDKTLYSKKSAAVS